MNDIQELGVVIEKLKKMISNITDEATKDCLQDFTDNLEAELTTREANYFSHLQKTTES